MHGWHPRIRPRAVLFDVDGTLVDSLKVITAGLGDAYERYADRRPSDDEILALAGIPLRTQLNLFRSAPMSDEQLSEAIAYTLGRYEVYEHLETTFEPAVDALCAVHAAGLKTALVTSKNSLELQGFMSRFSAAHAVDATVCACDVRNPKPDPESALLALEKLGVSADEAIFIGDSIFDIRCAHSAGVPAAAVTYGAGDPTALLAENPEVLIDLPEGLLAWAEATLNQPCLARSKT